MNEQNKVENWKKTENNSNVRTINSPKNDIIIDSEQIPNTNNFYVPKPKSGEGNEAKNATTFNTSVVVTIAVLMLIALILVPFTLAA